MLSRLLAILGPTPTTEDEVWQARLTTELLQELRVQISASSLSAAGHTNLLPGARERRGGLSVWVRLYVCGCHTVGKKHRLSLLSYMLENRSRNSSSVGRYWLSSEVCLHCSDGLYPCYYILRPSQVSVSDDYPLTNHNTPIVSYTTTGFGLS